MITKLSIVIPAYNEGKRLQATLDKILLYNSKANNIREIIVVDDGSTDQTLRLVEKYSNDFSIVSILKLSVNKGKGFAVRAGLEKSTGDYALFTDADLSTPIEDLDRLLPWTPKYDVIIGSRKLRESIIDVPQPAKRRFISFLGGWMRRLLLLLPSIHDTQCGFKLLSRKAILEVVPYAHINGYAFDIELLTIANAKNLKIKEVGVHWNHDTQGNLHLGKASTQVLRDIFVIKKNQLLGLYKNHKQEVSMQ